MPIRPDWSSVQGRGVRDDREHPTVSRGFVNRTEAGEVQQSPVPSKEQKYCRVNGAYPC